MRDDVMMQLADRVMNDAAFRSHARWDLDGALLDAGFNLTHEEQAAVRVFHEQYAGLTDEELNAVLADSACRHLGRA